MTKCHLKSIHIIRTVVEINKIGQNEIDTVKIHTNR